MLEDGVEKSCEGKTGLAAAFCPLLTPPSGAAAADPTPLPDLKKFDVGGGWDTGVLDPHVAVLGRRDSELLSGDRVKSIPSSSWF